MVWSYGLRRLWRRSGACGEDGFDLLEVIFGVDADGVEVGGFDVQADAVFEIAELFEPLGLLEFTGGQGGEAVESSFAIGVEADVLPVAGAGGVAVVRDGGAGEVEGAAVCGGDDFYGVGIGDIVWGAADLEGGDVDVGVAEGA